MAKVGEGDSRWIVQERQDGTNCNSWHWEEKDLTSATHEALKQKFKNFEMCSGVNGLTVTIKEISDISGDVTVAQRKGKIMCYFDIKLTMKFSSKVEGESDKGEGKIVAPEIDHDGFRDNFELSVTAGDAKVASKRGEEWLRNSGRAPIRQVFRDYFEGIFAQHNVGKFLNKSGGSPPPSASSGSSAAASPKPVSSTPKPVAAAPASKASLSWKLEWRCPVEELWQVLVDSGRASHYTRAPAKIDPRASGTFDYLGGLITGYFVDVAPYEKIAMQWRLSSWPSGTFSSVIMVLSREEAGVSRLEFAQAGIPDGEFDRVRDGWLRNFWDPIKAVFGFNYTVIE